MVGSKVLAELANSDALPTVKVFALEGNGASCIPHPTVLLNAPISGTGQFREKKYKGRCFLHALQIHKTTRTSTATLLLASSTASCISNSREASFCFLWVLGSGVTAGCHEQHIYSNPAKNKTPYNTLLSMKLKGFDDTLLVSIHLSNFLPLSSWSTKGSSYLEKTFTFDQT